MKLKVETLVPSGKTLRIPDGKPDPDAPIAGPFGMVITKTRCPFCDSEDVGGSGTDATWDRHCNGCSALWGVNAKCVYSHTGESVRALT